MASVPEICNLSLSHIGESAVVTSISPPDGSVQAARCATYYNAARRYCLQAHDWSFSTARQTLADLGTPTGPWGFRYSYPSNALRVSKVLPPTSFSHEPSQPFIVEVDSNGDRTILTNTETAGVVYAFDQVDPTRYTPAFTIALSWYLSSLLAPAIIKGKVGFQVGTSCLSMFVTTMGQAAMDDAAQNKMDRSSIKPPSISARL